MMRWARGFRIVRTDAATTATTASRDDGIAWDDMTEDETTYEIITYDVRHLDRER